jgi:hypothetical protein
MNATSKKIIQKVRENAYKHVSHDPSNLMEKIVFRQIHHARQLSGKTPGTRYAHPGPSLA